MQYHWACDVIGPDIFNFMLFFYLLRFAKNTVYSTLFNDNKKLIVMIICTVGWDMASDM